MVSQNLLMDETKVHSKYTMTKIFQNSPIIMKLVIRFKIIKEGLSALHTWPNYSIFKYVNIRKWKKCLTFQRVFVNLLSHRSVAQSNKKPRIILKIILSKTINSAVLFDSCQSFTDILGSCFFIREIRTSI